MSLQDPEKGFQPSGQHENGFDQRSENETMDSKAANILSSGASSPAATFTQASTAEDPSLVTFNGPDDPYNPYNLPMWKKWSYAIILGWLSLVVTFATSAFAPGTAQCATEFGVSIEVMYLATALFIAGFAIGPMFYGPLSELYGRKTPLFLGYTLFVIFQIPVAVAINVETIMLFRFLGGVAASGPLSVAGGYLADFFDPVRRGLALAILSGTTLVGILTGPFIGGFVVDNKSLGWRWTAWLTMMIAGIVGLVGLIFLPETYAPVLLKRKATKLRFETRNWALHSKLEESKIDIHSIVTRYLSRPVVMLMLEPILQALTLYMTFIYGFIYLMFEAYPISFSEERGWSLGKGGLPFLAVMVGVVLGSAYVYHVTNTTVRRGFEKNGKVLPEDRFGPMIWGAILFPVGVFWFAWTSYPSMNPWPQILSGLPIGAGLQMIYLQGLVYMVDVYTINANSGISANAFVRSLVAAGFVMFARPMYHNLGVRWASSLLGFLGVAFIPVPIVFFYYGERIRKMSKYSPKM